MAKMGPRWRQCGTQMCQDEARMSQDGAKISQEGAMRAPLARACSGCLLTSADPRSGCPRSRCLASSVSARPPARTWRGVVDWCLTPLNGSCDHQSTESRWSEMGKNGGKIGQDGGEMSRPTARPSVRPSDYIYTNARSTALAASY